MDIYFELKRTVKQTVVYALGNMATKVAGLILVPLYTKYLFVSEYGMLGLLELVLQIMIALGGLGLSPALIRWYSLAHSEEEKRKILFTATLASAGVGAILFSISLFISDSHTELLFGLGTPFAYYVRLVVLTAVFEIVLLVPLSLLRIQERALLHSIVSIIRFTLVVVLNIVFVAVFNLGIEGVLLGILVSTVLAFAMTVPYLRKNIQVNLLRGQLREMLRYGVPVMGASLAIIVLNLGDRYLLKIFSTLDSVGLYTLGYRIAGVINLLFVSSFGLGFYPAIFRIDRGTEGKAFLSKMFTYFTFAAFWTILGLSLFGEEITHLIAVNPQYWNASSVVFPLSVGFGLYGMFNVLLAGFFLEKRTGLISALVSVGVLLNIGLNILLIPRWDIMGAAVATVLAYGSMVAATALFLNKVYPVDYQWGRVLTVILLTAGLYTLSALWRGTTLWTNIVLDLVIVASFPLILSIARFFEAEDLRRARNWVSRIFSHSTLERP